MSDPIPLDIAQALAAPGVSARLGICAGRLSYHAAVSSTNDVALELARSGASAGTSVVASTQSAGRGRRGRSWFSPSDLGVYVSVVLDNVVSPTVTLLAGVAAAEAIRASSGVPVELEWPNDLVLSSGASTRSYRRAKLGGVLTEAVNDGAGTSLVVVGIGVNVAAAEYPASLDRPITCLDAHAASPIARGNLVVEILCALAAWQTRCIDDGVTPMLERWGKLSPSSAGVTVGWESPDGPRSGVTDGIGPSGSLRVRVGDRIENIVGGTLDWQVGGS